MTIVFFSIDAGHIIHELDADYVPLVGDIIFIEAEDELRGDPRPLKSNKKDPYTKFTIISRDFSLGIRGSLYCVINIKGNK